jgi:hypothetical protein
MIVLDTSGLLAALEPRQREAIPSAAARRRLIPGS